MEKGKDNQGTVIQQTENEIQEIIRKIEKGESAPSCSGQGQRPGRFPKPKPAPFGHAAPSASSGNGLERQPTGSRRWDRNALAVLKKMRTSELKHWAGKFYTKQNDVWGYCFLEQYNFEAFRNHGLIESVEGEDNIYQITTEGLAVLN